MTRIVRYINLESESGIFAYRIAAEHFAIEEELARQMSTGRFERVFLTVEPDELIREAKAPR